MYLNVLPCRLEWHSKWILIYLHFLPATHTKVEGRRVGEGHPRKKKVKLATVSAPCQIWQGTLSHLRETSSEICKLGVHRLIFPPPLRVTRENIVLQ